MDTRLVRNSETSDAASTGGRSRYPAMAATIRQDPSGVFVTPTFAAAIRASVSTTWLTPRADAAAAPSAAPMKNSGMMKPPRQPADTLLDEASDFTPPARRRG